MLLASLLSMRSARSFLMNADGCGSADARAKLQHVGNLLFAVRPQNATDHLQIAANVSARSLQVAHFSARRIEPLGQSLRAQ
jgi:hypothetical protein